MDRGTLAVTDLILPLDGLSMRDIARVGGKNASLGEMICNLADSGVRVPGGFATTAEAYRTFLESGALAERIQKRLGQLDVRDVRALASAGIEIRDWITKADLPTALVQAITQSYMALGADVPVAVRSSATAEDLPDASFAGQQETLLNVRGISSVLAAVKRVFASLYTDRAISYRVQHGFAHETVALSAGIQRMVRSDLASSGVAFTLDTESGFRDVVFITAAWGLGETVVQGAVNPDEFYVHKPTLRAGFRPIVRRTLGDKTIRMVYAGGDAATRIEDVPAAQRVQFALTDDEILDLARMALAIENHYGRPMDIEWAKDGVDGQLYIVQARPETVKSRANAQSIERFELESRSRVLTTGRAIGARIGQGRARIVSGPADMDKVREGDVLVTDMTDPDWEPVMKRAAAIVTNRGGRTCHAAIVARELGVPAVVGCGDATRSIPEGAPVTVSCAEGDDGFIYDGALKFTRREMSIAAMPRLPLKVMMNVGNPERAFDFSFLPNEGVGLARLEFVINRMIGIHPRAILEPAKTPPSVQQLIAERARGYASAESFYVEKLTEGIATLAAAFCPKPVIVRCSDFKSNEYANLIGGESFEPKEENPMIGFRGASRYIAPEFRACFALECRALRSVRETLGLKNVEIMIPFVRTVAEAREVVGILHEHGLRRGENGLRLIMMCEIPSNALLADEFLEYFDGFSIGSNDLTQLTLGLDRDSNLVAHLFDERDAAVKALLMLAITACKRQKKYIGICGQGPSDHPDLAHWLLERGIDSVSLNPDTVVDTWLFLAGQKVK